MRLGVLAVIVTGLPTLLQAYPAPVELNSCSSFAILSGISISSTGSGIINGDVGLYPAGSQGIPPAQINGNIYNGGPIAEQAQLHLTDAYNDAAIRSLDRITVSGNIGGLTLAPGLYWSETSLQITGDLRLDAGGDADAVWIFQMGSTLTTAAGGADAAGSRVILAGGAQAQNIFWQVGSSATLGTYSVFKGTILAQESITMNTESVMSGRALARTGSVVYNGSSGSLPSTIYVAPGGGHIIPYDTWAKAANNMNDAIAFASPDTSVLVSNGTYNLNAQLVVQLNVNVQSVNGPAVTIIVGTGTDRCVTLSGGIAGLMQGFTISNGSANNGGGVYMGPDTMLIDCVVSGNQSSQSGGGIYATDRNLIQDCVVSDNTTVGSGGGINASNIVRILNVVVTGNSAVVDGGGVYMDEACRLESSEISGNMAGENGGGVFSRENSTILNCTVVSNEAVLIGGGVYAVDSVGVNCIIWQNTVTSGSSSANLFMEGTSGFTYTCSSPLIIGAGNTDTDPLFLDAAGGNYHLQPTSPAVNAGINQAWMDAANDLHGHDRIRYGTADMGAYEHYLWYRSTNLGSDWNWLGWFGYFNEVHFPWIYHNQHGWWYSNADATDALWIYTMDMGWVWTRDSLYPYIYRRSDTSWLWYQPGSSAPRWFYNLSAGQWESR